MFTVLILSLFAILTSIISAVIGMAGGIVLLSFMTFFLTLEIIIPVHGIVQLASNGSRALYLLQNVHRGIIAWFALGAPIGAFVSAYFIQKLDDERLPLILIAALIFYVLFKPKKLPPLKIPIPAFALVGLATGFLGLLIGAVGPLLAPFFLRDDLKKEEIIGSKAACQVLVHTMKVPAFLYLGFAYQDHIFLIAAMVIGALIGTKLGVIALGKLDENIFRWIYRTALLAAAIRLIYKVIEQSF